MRLGKQVHNAGMVAKAEENAKELVVFGGGLPRMNTNAAVRGFVAFRFAVCRSAPGRLFGSRDAAKGQAECCRWGVCRWEAFSGVRGVFLTTEGTEGTEVVWVQ